MQNMSESFDVQKGVKQEAVSSPSLYCVFMDGLLVEIERSNVGRYMGGIFVVMTSLSHHPVFKLWKLWCQSALIMRRSMPYNLMLKRVK